MFPSVALLLHSRAFWHRGLLDAMVRGRETVGDPPSRARGSPASAGELVKGRILSQPGRNSPARPPEARDKNEWEIRLGEGVYPPVAKESVRKGKGIKGIHNFLWDDDGDEGSTSD